MGDPPVDAQMGREGGGGVGQIEQIQTISIKETELFYSFARFLIIMCSWTV